MYTSASQTSCFATPFQKRFFLCGPLDGLQMNTLHESSYTVLTLTSSGNRQKIDKKTIIQFVDVINHNHWD